MFSEDKKRNKIMLLLFSILFCSTYFPFILFGGYAPGDDIGLAISTPSFNSFINYTLQRLGGSNYHRPIAWLFGCFILTLFHNNAILYIVLNLIMWLLSVVLISYTIKNILGKYVAWLFILLSSFPFFISAILNYHIVCFHQYLLPIIFWALSLILLRVYVFQRHKIYYLSAYLSLILGILSSAMLLPLLIVVMLLPLIYEYENVGKMSIINLMKLSIRYVTPVITIAIVYLFFYLYGYKIYTDLTQPYAVSPIGIISILQALYFFIAIVVEVPLMLVEVIPHMLKWQVMISGTLITFFIYIIRKNLLNEKVIVENNNKISIEKFFICIVFISLMFGCSILLISNYPATTFGFYNRMLLPAFIMVSTIISWLFSKMLRTRWFIFPIIISILWVSSMTVQLDNFIKSWEMREKISADLSVKLNSSDLGEKPILIANMPYFLINNYNNEEVTFCTWAFDAHLKLAGAPEMTAWPISYRIVNDPLFYPAHNILNNLSRISDDGNIWYYEYEEGNEKGMFKKLGNKKALLEKFEEIKVKKINYHPIILREKIRLGFKKFPLVWETYKQKLPEKIKQNI
jgi:hypothetical protein